VRHKSIKVDRNKYRVLCPKRRMQISADLKMSICEHKGRLIVAFTTGFDNVFWGCDTLNRTQAIKMIEFLSNYVHMVKPTVESVINANIKAKTNSIQRDSAEYLALIAKMKSTKERRKNGSKN